MKIGKSKAKGNKFENRVAKELGVWFFNDKDALQRHLTSGAQKSVWVSDIVPQKQLRWGGFPFLIESKNGYKSQLPTLYTQTLVRDWLVKALDERTEAQPIIWLIAKFHRCRTLLITDTPFNHTKIFSPITLNVVYNNAVMPFYIYDYDGLLSFDFYELISHNKPLLEVCIEDDEDEQ
ncbi:MAG: hypothetical protein DRG78_05430 [Epsilonproteobacteria bacterium]|nr:MAG: hypothetical protein DRG78_05430 [Campylobacterota bacterium]